jgi:AraC family transcriptional regulator, transcriptional activator of pobA
MPRSPASAASPHRPSVLATQIQTTLADQTWSTRTIDGAPCFRAFLLRRGRAAFTSGEASPVELMGPQAFWAPYKEGGQFRVYAGGSGAWILATEDLISRIIGDNPLSASLRPALDRPLVASAERIEPVVVELEALFSALSRETADPGLGAPAMSALYLGLIVMHLWRGCADTEGDALDAAMPTAQRFRQLVEMHYRDNWCVDEFCGALNVTRAHLHNACMRALGRPPQRLVHERLAVEARLRLRQSALPIEQVAYNLGFRDPAYFNRFFRRLTGVSPGAYRKAVRVSPPKEQTSFEAWP